MREDGRGKSVGVAAGVVKLRPHVWDLDEMLDRVGIGGILGTKFTCPGFVKRRDFGL